MSTETPTRTRRTFKIGSATIADPDPSKSIKECQTILARTHPEITNGTFTEKHEGGKLVVEFVGKVRTKG